jgi:hypothetical protein
MGLTYRIQSENSPLVKSKILKNEDELRMRATQSIIKISGMADLNT